MTLNRNLFLSSDGLAADGALHAVGQTGLSAGCSLAGDDFLGVTQSVNIVADIGVTTDRAGIRGEAIAEAVALSYNSFVLVFMTLDHQGANVCADILAVHIDSDHSVLTNLGGSSLRPVCLAAFRNACVVDAQSILRVDQSTAVLGNGNVDGILLAELNGHILKVHIHSAGNMNYATDDGHGEVDHVATNLVAQVCQLSVHAVSQILHQAGHNLVLDTLQHQSAVSADAHNDVADQSLSISDLAAVDISSGCEVELGHQVAGVDAVLVGIDELQISNLHVGIDHQNTGIHGGIVVGVGDNADHQIQANILAVCIIIEGQDGLCGQLLDHLDQLVEGSNIQLHVSCSSQLGSIGLDLLQSGNELANGQLVFHQTVLSNQLISPSGQIHIHLAVNGVQQIGVSAIVCINLSGNNSSIGDHGRILGSCRNIQGILHIDILTVVLDQLVVDSDLRLRGSDDQHAGSQTHLGDIASGVLTIIGGGDQVSTCVDGSLGGRLIGGGIGLQTGVGDLQVAIGEHLAISTVDRSGHSLAGVVKLTQEDIVLILVIELYRGHAGNNYDGSNDGNSIVEVIAEIYCEGDFDESTNSEISTVGGNLIQFSHKLALVVDAEENLVGLFADCFVLRLERSIIIGRCLEIKALQQLPGIYAVFVCIVPIQIDLGGLGLDDNIADIISSLVVGVGTDSAVQIGADIGRIATTKGDSEVIARLSDTAEGLQSLSQDAQRGVVEDVQILAQLGQRHAHALRSVGTSQAQQAIQSVLQIGRQNQLNLAIQTIDAVLIDVQRRDIKTNNKLDKRIGNISLLAVCVAQGDCSVSNGSISGPVNHVDIGQVKCSRGLGHSDVKGSLAGLIGIVTVELEGQFVAGVGNVLTLEGVSTGDSTAAYILTNLIAILVRNVNANEGSQIFVSVILVNDLDVLALYVGSRTGILQGNIGLNRTVFLLGNLDSLDDGLSLGIVETEGMCAVVHSCGVNVVIDCLQIVLCIGKSAINELFDGLSGHILRYSLLKRYGILDLRGKLAAVDIEFQPQLGHVEINGVANDSLQTLD